VTHASVPAPLERLPRVALVGAGSSGIAALKGLRDAGLDTTCFETSDRVGGNWVFGNVNGMSAAYRSLHINTSRGRMAYADLPMPADYPDFPHHTHIARYFGDYVSTFDLAPAIRFRTSVQSAAPRPGGGWEVTSRDLEHGTTSTEGFDALVVANGHHWDARWPDPAYPGQADFPGRQVHAHDFLDNDGLAGQRVMVVGMGNSAMDIAVESSWVAERTILSSRTPVHVVPKYVFGRPLDTLQQGAVARLPWRLRQAATEAVLRVAVGRYEAYGLTKPAHGVFQAHPTISDTILSRLAHGEVVPRTGIDRFEGSDVVFTDGRRETVDVVIWCTGYRITWPFLDPSVISAPDNVIDLYERIWPVDVPALAFIGLVQPLGAIMPIAERQGRLVADWLRGRYALPPAGEAGARISADAAATRRRYVGSKRHTIQVDFDSYLHGLDVEQRAGARRATAQGYPIPVPVRRLSGAGAGAA